MAIAAGWGSKATPSQGLLKEWRATRKAWREARGLQEKFLCYKLIKAHMSRVTAWAVILTTAGVGFPAATSLCVHKSGTLQNIGEFLKNLSERFNSSPPKNN